MKAKVSGENFWQELSATKPQGWVGLSPMDGVTDLPMRLVTAKYGVPDVIFTEFTNVEGWRRGAKALRKQLRTRPEIEGKTVAQLYGLDPENFKQVAAELAAEGKFSGIDINMGCPAKNVAQNGAGAGLIKNRQLAQEIYEATVEGVKVGAPAAAGAKQKANVAEKQITHTKTQVSANQVLSPLPISIKTRLGYEKLDLDWLGFILEELKPAALTIHGRTYRQGYAGQADWNFIGRAAQLAQEIKSDTVILGNGDVQNRQDGEQKCQQSGVNGALIGRAAMGNPFVFWSSDQLQTLDSTQMVIQKIKIAIEHAQLYEQLFAAEEKYSFLPMRKHLAWYVRGFPGASEARAQLVQTNSAAEAREILEDLLKNMALAEKR